MSTFRGTPDPTWNCWFEIDLSAVRKNVRAIRDFVGPQVKIMAVVKADGYGHGAIPVAQAVVEAGADWLAVANLQEGIELRQGGLQAPILILGPGFPSQAETILEHDLAQTVCTQEMMGALSEAAAKMGKMVGVHLKVDTGMGRLGVSPSEAVDFAKLVLSLPGLELQGVFSHLATAGRKDPSYAQCQIEQMRQVVADLEEAGIKPSLRHMVNSAGMFKFPEAHWDMVRPGGAIYGLPPVEDSEDRLALQLILTWKGRVGFVKRVPAGTKVSYGGKHTTSKETSIATLPLGYADGCSEALSNRGGVLFRGKRFPMVGMVCMDHIMVDLGNEQEIEIGEEVVLIGKQGNEEITAKDLARSSGTGLYELLARLGKRVPRIYVEGGKEDE